MPTERPSRLALLRAFDSADSELGQALALLTACGIADADELPVGMIDRLLLAVHRLLLGSDLELVAACPSCQVLNALPLGPADVPEYAPRSACGGRGAGLREPTGADLTGLPPDAGAASAVLAARCAIGPAAEPRDPAWLDAAEQSLCGVVHAACTECSAPIAEFADVQRLVTASVAAAIAEADVEVHLLASRYGWDLASIEALPDARRSRLAALARGASG